MTLAMVPYLLAFLLLVVGLYAIVAKRNIIKVIVGLAILDYAVNLFLVLVGYRPSGEGAPVAPILTGGAAGASALAQRAVDPLPQALVLTSIVGGRGRAGRPPCCRSRSGRRSSCCRSSSCSPPTRRSSPGWADGSSRSPSA